MQENKLDIKLIKEKIRNLKMEILEKEDKLDELITQYQELSGIELYDDENNDDLTETD